MEITLLGPLVVTRDGRPLELGGAQPRLLLALLALDPGRVVGADRLVDGIWGAQLPSEPANALQVVVSRLRRALAPDQVVLSRPPGYLLAVDPERVDAVRFERLAAAGRAAQQAGEAERAAGLLRAALDLWRGDALADFPGVPAARAAATRLEELRLAALEDRIGLDLGLGRQAQVVGELQALVEREPLRERLHAQLMRALYATGRQADALAAYQRARAVLAERAGLDPGPDLRRLEAQLLAQDPSLATAPELSTPPPRPAEAPEPAGKAAEAAAPAGPGPEPGKSGAGGPAPGAASNLRAALTSFVGREQEIGQVRAMLGRGRLVTLVGPGGAGKTRLAVEAVNRLLAAGETGRDGAWLVELASLEDPALLPEAVLDAVSPRLELPRLEGPVGGEGDSAARRLLRALRSRHLLLVLDNCEHLVEAAAGLVETILGACPGVRVLATSREALRVPGELRLPVPALPIPPEDLDDPRELLAFDAGRLFVERARAVVPNLELGALQARAVAEICRRLDGLPFAIELAAARVNVLPVTDLAARLHDRFRLLTTGARTALPRHRTLRAVVDWSWELLTPAEQVALRRLAVFTGGCTLEAAERVCADTGERPGLPAVEVAAAVAGLVEKSLVELAPGATLPPPFWPGIERADLPPVPALPLGEPRYRLLETVRAYAGERLAEAGEAETVAREHAHWCVDEVARSQTRLRGADQLLWWTRAHAEHANLRAGLRWLLDRGEAAGAVTLAGGLAWHQGFFGQRAEALADLRAAVALPGGPRDRGRAEAMATFGWVGMWAGDGPEAFGARIAEAASIFREVGEPAHADLIAMLGRNIQERMRQQGRGLPTPTSPPPPSSFDARAVDAALAEDEWTHVIAWYAMVSVMTMTLERANHGDLAGARRDAELLLERMRRHGDRLGMIDCHELLSGISLFEGDLGQAEAHLRESLRLACELRYPTEMAVQLGRLGEVDLGAGDPASARGHLEQALAAFRQLGLPDMAASMGNALGMVAAAEGDLVRAAAEHEAALAAYRQLGDDLGVAASEVLLGLVAARGGAPQRAGELLERALGTARRDGNPILASFALGAMAVVAAERGEAERAAVLFGAGEWQEGVGGSLIFGRRVVPWPMLTRLADETQAALRAVLGDQRFEAALARGRALGPERVVGGVTGRPEDAGRLGAREDAQPTRR
jgi:predicted ATPase/DNA-binding SARP family transcriptional activator